MLGAHWLFIMEAEYSHWLAAVMEVLTRDPAAGVHTETLLQPSERRKHHWSPVHNQFTTSSTLALVFDELSC